MGGLPRRLAFGALICAGFAYAQASSDGIEFFESKIRPLLASKCYACHGEALASSRLRLDSKQGWERGGNRATAIIPGDANASLLIQAVSYTNPALKMPPSGRLSDQERADLAEWIRMGAPDPRESPAAALPATSGIDFEQARKFWAFQPIRKAVPPGVKKRDWVRSPIDAFLLAALEAKGLEPAAPADKSTLLRRVTFDLIGLPPTPEEVAAFLADKSPNAYEKVVERLLACRITGNVGPGTGSMWCASLKPAATSSISNSRKPGDIATT